VDPRIQRAAELMAEATGYPPDMWRNLLASSPESSSRNEPLYSISTSEIPGQEFLCYGTVTWNVVSQMWKAFVDLNHAVVIRQVK